MDPWSKVDYSRHIREASMEMEGLPEVISPSDRVPGQRLLAAPILKRRWNREEIGKRLLFSVFPHHGEYIGEGGSQGGHQGPSLPLGAATPRARHQGAWGLGGGPLAPPR